MKRRNLARRTRGLGVVWSLLLASALCGIVQGAWAKPIQILHCQGGAFRVSFSPDSRLVAVAEHGSDSSKPAQVEVWAVGTASVVHTLPYPDEVESVAFSPQGHVLAAGSEGSDVVLWDTRTWQRIAGLTGTTSCYALAFSPDGKRLATAPNSRRVQLWSVSTHQPLRRLPWKGSTEWQINALAFSPDGGTVAGCTDDSGPTDDSALVRLWNTATGQTRRTFRAHQPNVNSVAFSPNGRLFATGSNDGSAELWDTRRWRVRRRIRAQGPSAVFAAAFSPDGRWLGLACGEPNAAAVLISTATGRKVHTYRQGQGRSQDMFSLAFSPDGHLLATTSSSASDTKADNALYLWAIPRK